MFFKTKVFWSAISTLKFFLSSESEDVFSDSFLPKYFGLFVKPDGFRSFFFEKLDFPLKPKLFFSPSLDGLSLKLDFPLKPKLFFSPSLNGLSDLLLS